MNPHCHKARFANAGTIVALGVPALFFGLPLIINHILCPLLDGLSWVMGL